MSKADLHLHLNGSFSDSYLESCAKKNSQRYIEGQAFVKIEGSDDAYQAYLEFKEIEKELADLLANTAIDSKERARKITQLTWLKFSKIHKIVRTLKDICLGTINVAETSEANYLEIRTTPKSSGESQESDYVQAFVEGLEYAATHVLSPKGKLKKPYGVLSLDRTIHGLEDAERFIGYIKQDQTGRLVGLDISGNFMGPRKLTGEELKQTLELALSESIPIAIHMGESDSDIEKADTDTILDLLETWKAQHGAGNDQFYWGKIRLGHCIYLTDEQRQRIKNLNLPIEVCPTCHNRMNWHQINSAHPVSKIYPDGRNLVPGTDDTALFQSGFNAERARLYTLFGRPAEKPDDTSKEFRFSPQP